MTDHSPCLPHFLLLNAENKSSSRTDEIRHYDCHVKFENNTSGRARFWDTALKFLCPGLSITSPDHLAKIKKFKYLCNISSLCCSSPSCDVTIGSRRKIHGGQTYGSYVIVERDWLLQFDQRHIIVEASHCRVIIRMYDDFVDWEYFLVSFHCSKIVFTCSQLDKMF